MNLESRKTENLTQWILGKTNHRFLGVGALVLLLLLGLVYTVQRARFVQKANARFDPNERAFTGLFLPWPLGRPSLVGQLDPRSDRRIRDSLGYEMGKIGTNGMTLILHASDGTFFIHAE